jgi:hypothetical protein
MIENIISKKSKRNLRVKKEKLIMKRHIRMVGINTLLKKFKINHIQNKKRNMPEIIIKISLMEIDMVKVTEEATIEVEEITTATREAAEEVIKVVGEVIEATMSNEIQAQLQVGETRLRNSRS